LQPEKSIFSLCGEKVLIFLLWLRNNRKNLRFLVKDKGEEGERICLLRFAVSTGEMKARAEW
jgi:hypothetical protein